MKVQLRVRIGHEEAHYAGNLAAGAKVMELFGDVATEIASRHDGDEGLLRAYENVEFLAPVHGGDFLEVRGELLHVGNTSRKIRFEAYKVMANTEGAGDASAVDLLEAPVLVARAIGTTVVPKAQQRRLNP